MTATTSTSASTWHVTPVLSIEGLYSFNGLGDKRISIPVSPVVNPTGRIWHRPDRLLRRHEHAVRDGERHRPAAGGQRQAVSAWSAWASTHRPIKVTTPSVGYAPGYCDPWWYVCYPGGWVPVENIVGERSSTDFGMDFGGGVRFGAIYAELRYHYIWGPTIEAVELPVATHRHDAAADRVAGRQERQRTVSRDHLRRSLLTPAAAGRQRFPSVEASRESGPSEAPASTGRTTGRCAAQSGTGNRRRTRTTVRAGAA